MTESRPPGPRRADARSSDRGGPNPLERPLPPGLARRPTTHAAPDAAPPPDPRRGPGQGDAAVSTAGAPNQGRRARSAAVPRAASAAPSVAAPNGRARPTAARPTTTPPTTARPTTTPPTTARPTTARPTPARPVAAARSAGAESEIPLMAPPAWQLAELRAEEQQGQPVAASAQRGLPSWAALVVLLAITGVGGLIDAIAGASIKGAFSIGLVVGSLAAILLVRRSGMFPVVVAPPLVYFVASAVLLYFRSGGFSNVGAITDAATNWLVYGFPAIAGATAFVLIVAGVRMILHR